VQNKGAKRAKRSIKNFYTLPSGQPKFKSLEVNAELEIFRLDDPRDKEKAAERLGAIGQSVRKGAYNPTEAERFWLRSLVVNVLERYSDDNASKYVSEHGGGHDSEHEHDSGVAASMATNMTVITDSEHDSGSDVETSDF